MTAGGCSISALLIAWYERNRRELPWRETSDAYRIWISEVILQQTRVAQGIGYYRRFIDRFPDAAAVAGAPEDEVLKLWQGLGYYSRARNLHAAAREIVGRFGGRFPDDMKEALSLRGVGEYTAAAVCSIAYGVPRAVVDGNVFRVLSRLFAEELPIDSTAGKHRFSVLADSLLDKTRPGLHNQAMMELGALLCVPRTPDCAACPLREHCLAFRTGRAEDFPVKAGKSEPRDRYFHYLDIRSGGRALLSRREARDIWRGLYEFPLIETCVEAGFEELERTELFSRLLGAVPFRVREGVAMPRHRLSHQTIHARFYRIEAERLPAVPEFIPVAESALDDYAVSRLTELYLERG